MDGGERLPHAWVCECASRVHTCRRVESAVCSTPTSVHPSAALRRSQGASECSGRAGVGERRVLGWWGAGWESLLWGLVAWGEGVAELPVTQAGAPGTRLDHMRTPATHTPTTTQRAHPPGTSSSGTHCSAVTLVAVNCGSLVTPLSPSTSALALRVGQRGGWCWAGSGGGTVRRSAGWGSGRLQPPRPPPQSHAHPPSRHCLEPSRSPEDLAGASKAPQVWHPVNQRCHHQQTLAGGASRRERVGRPHARKLLRGGGGGGRGRDRESQHASMRPVHAPPPPLNTPPLSCLLGRIHCIRRRKRRCAQRRPPGSRRRRRLGWAPPGLGSRQASLDGCDLALPRLLLLLLALLLLLLLLRWLVRRGLGWSRRRRGLVKLCCRVLSLRVCECACACACACVCLCVCVCVRQRGRGGRQQGCIPSPPLTCSIRGRLVRAQPAAARCSPSLNTHNYNHTHTHSTHHPPTHPPPTHPPTTHPPAWPAAPPCVWRAPPPRSAAPLQ